MSHEQLYLNVNEVSHLLGVSAKTVIRWSQESRSMPVLRRGRVVRFPRQRLLAWLEAQEPARAAQGSSIHSQVAGSTAKPA